MRPDPLMDLLLLVAILLGAILTFVFLWLLMRKYGASAGLEPRIDEVSTLQQQASTGSMRPAGYGEKPHEAVGPDILPYERNFASSARRPSLIVEANTTAQPPAPIAQALPSNPDKVPAVPSEKDSRSHRVTAPADKRRQKEATRGGAVEGDAGGGKATGESSSQVSRAKKSSGRQAKATEKPLTAKPTEDAAAAASTSDAAGGADKKAPGKEETWITSGLSNLAEQTREDTGVTSGENTTSRGGRRHRKKSKKHGPAGVSALESISPKSDISSKKKRMSRHGKAGGTSGEGTSAGEGIVGSGQPSPTQEQAGGSFIPPNLRRRSSTRSKLSRKSGKTPEGKSAGVSPPAGWTTHDPGAAVASPGGAIDADAFLPELSDLGELSPTMEPPTPPVPNLDVFSREPSTIETGAPPIAVSPLVPNLDLFSQEHSPYVAATPSGPPRDKSLKGCKEAPTPMKPNLDVFSLERSPYVPATPKSRDTLPDHTPNAPS
ncbi:hypothetical protein V5799_004404 [Amblyomma americanum]|uniref:Uncharacterized protein n=1 Tax=Amblyomma americanum TaxID=6943 RepID=A0AAQ4D680_AMBAM